MIDSANLSPWLLLVAPLVVIVALHGVRPERLRLDRDLGADPRALPAGAYLVPLMALLDLRLGVFVGEQGASSREAGAEALIPFMFVGFVVGVTLLVSVPGPTCARRSASSRRRRRAQHRESRAHAPISRWWSVPAGIVGGAVATVFGAGGPIYATYLSGACSDKDEMRATDLHADLDLGLHARAASTRWRAAAALAIFVGASVLAPFVWIGSSSAAHPRGPHAGADAPRDRRAARVTGRSLLARAFV
jgi:uncharacterized membrane protein YfcA